MGDTPSVGAELGASQEASLQTFESLVSRGQTEKYQWDREIFPLLLFMSQHSHNEHQGKIKQAHRSQAGVGPSASALGAPPSTGGSDRGCEVTAPTAREGAGSTIRGRFAQAAAQITPCGHLMLGYEIQTIFNVFAIKIHICCIKNPYAGEKDELRVDTELRLSHRTSTQSAALFL